MNILDVLVPEAIKVPLDATEKQAAITELIDLLARLDRISNPKRLKSVVWEREQQRSTGIGEGLAIPHGKSDCSNQVVMAMGIPAQPIEFGAVDRKPVRLIVLLASPPDRTADHIQALGKISRLMSDAGFREQAYNSTSSTSLYELLRDAEQ